MKNLNKYFLLMLIVLISGYFITNNKSINIDENDYGVEINENIEYQTYSEKKSINNLTYDDFKNSKLSSKKVQEIIEYKKYMGAIKTVDELRFISRFSDDDIEIIKQIFTDETHDVNYKSHNINIATKKQLKFLGLSSKDVNKIINYRKNKNIENLIELKSIISESYSNIKGGVIFDGNDI
ncbi:hypothetical protein [Caviibacter abscessus]|uniref:hypothetical protein n=1 Tax=Caviibacter abscessus TaxID=1766719 RepID=UPI000835BD06|nr:hypothetical protein [Caviibacter abscessus]